MTYDCVQEGNMWVYVWWIYLGEGERMKILAGRENSMYQGPVTENNESWSENPQSG